MQLDLSFSGLKTAVDLVKSAIAARDDALITKALEALTERHIETQNRCLDLLERNEALVTRDRDVSEENRQLRAEMAKLLDQKERIARDFELTLADYTTPVFAPKAGSPFAGKEMYLCAHCAERAQASYLYPTDKHRMFKCLEGHGPIRI